MASVAEAARVSLPVRSGGPSDPPAQEPGSPCATVRKGNRQPSRTVPAPHQPISGPRRSRYRRIRGRCRALLHRHKEAFTQEVRAIDRGARRDASGGRPRWHPVRGDPRPDLYLFGEETGLEEVIERRPPLPRMARPFMLGLFATPPNENLTLVNNVETLASPSILAEGPDWLRANGTEASPGTMVFTVCGDVQREGVNELPLGTPSATWWRNVPEARRRAGRARPSSRASNTVILPEQIDTPMDFDSMRQVGAGLGSEGSRCSTTPRAWCGRPTSTPASSGWSPAPSAPPANSGPAR